MNSKAIIAKNRAFKMIAVILKTVAVLFINSLSFSCDLLCRRVTRVTITQKI